ncbi:MAG: TonB-dependent receptor [Bacteroidota bacterium]|nr:TonB-dependent receptor [Bacteroidota bacterium]
MKALYLFVFALIISTTIFAQMPGGRAGGQSMNMGHFYGKVVDANNNKPLDVASVQLSQTRMDTATKKRRDFVIAAMLTNKRGEFSIESLPVLGNYQILITAVGFTTYNQKISFNLKMNGSDMSQMMNAVDKDLGNIKMAPSAEQLAGVVVTANKSMMQMNIDRKVFNVDKSLTSAGGTAIDVMKNVPSVNVDIDGNVTLRNATPQIFIDGRPTTLTLDQIPADEIESVEIITNPSAKFDASGGGAGILNIVLKKNRKAGYNGNLRANLDSRLSYGLGADINVKQGKINFFANTMYNQRKSISTQTTDRVDYINGATIHLSQKDKPNSTGHFAFGRAGFDYLPDNRNTFTLSGVIVGGKFNTTDLLNIGKDTTLGTYLSSISGLSNTTGGFSFNNYGGTLSYKHNFAKAGKDITADGNYNYSTNTGTQHVSTQYYNPDNSLHGPLGQQMSNSAGNTKYFTAQTDYTDPITDKIKLEAGLRAAIRNYSSENQNFNFDSSVSKFISIPALNSRYKFKDEVYAGYMTFSQKINKFTYQLGGRIESSKYSGTLIDSNQTFKNSYPFSFFPSVFLTQKLNDKQDMQLNYSRKINRPNFFQLIPYYNYTDSLNISRGNPNLKPEFTNLLELSYSVNFKNGNNIIATAYYRNTNDLITLYQYRDKNPNPAKSDSIFISSYANANSSDAYGLEVTASNKIASWWTLISNVNLYNSKLNGSNLQSNLSNQRVSWFGKLNNTFTLKNNYSIQLTGDYTSKTILPPGRGGGGGGRFYGGGSLALANGYTDPIYGVDIAVKKDFLKDKAASVSISMNDIFRTRVYKTHSESDLSKTVYSVQNNERIRDPQIIRLNLNYRFGKFDVSLFKRKNLKAEQEGMQNGMQGVSQ